MSQWRRTWRNRHIRCTAEPRTVCVIIVLLGGAGGDGNAHVVHSSREEKRSLYRMSVMDLWAGDTPEPWKLVRRSLYFV